MPCKTVERWAKHELTLLIALLAPSIAGRLVALSRMVTLYLLDNNIQKAVDMPKQPEPMMMTLVLVEVIEELEKVAVVVMVLKLSIVNVS